MRVHLNLDPVQPFCKSLVKVKLRGISRPQSRVQLASILVMGFLPIVPCAIHIIIPLVLHADDLGPGTTCWVTCQADLKLASANHPP
jgi:hypothetical protein